MNDSSTLIQEAEKGAERFSESRERGKSRERGRAFLRAEAEKGAERFSESYEFTPGEGLVQMHLHGFSEQGLQHQRAPKRAFCKVAVT